jgi:hypothetical protein
MLRPFISYVFIFSLLFMGIEGAVDSAGGEHPHGDDYSHVLDSVDSLSLDSDYDGHCSHCCHGHAGSIAGHGPALNCDMAHQQFAFYQPHFLNFSQAPPTPPPNV